MAMTLVQDIEDYTDYDAFLNQTQVEGEREVHIRVTHHKRENAWSLTIVEEKFEGGMNNVCGPFRELSLSEEQAKEMIEKW